MSERSVLILGAGIGSRLRPITDTIPKVMVEVAPRLPLLEHTLRGLKAQGFRHFVVNLHYLPKVIREYFGDGGSLGVRIEYSDESSRLCDTAGAIRRAALRLSESFVLLYGDQLHAFDVASLTATHECRRAAVTLLVKRSDHPQNGDLARVVDGGRIVEWIPRPHPHHDFGPGLYLNTGAYVIEKRALLPYITQEVMSLDKSAIPLLLNDGIHVSAVVTDADVLDIGTPDKLNIARQWYADHKREIDAWYGRFAPERPQGAVYRS